MFIMATDKKNRIWCHFMLHVVYCIHSFFPKLAGNFNMAGMTKLLVDFASKKIDKNRIWFYYKLEMTCFIHPFSGFLPTQDY